MAHILSKSTFMYGRQCIKRLYLNKYKKNECDPYDDKTMALFAQGTDVGNLARQLFPGGADAQGEAPFASTVTAAYTQKLLPVHHVIYEAAFVHEGILCAVDILVRKGKKYYAYEVKSVNSHKPQHIQDAALQYHVLSNCGIELADFSIVHFNREYVRVGDLDIQQLFTPTSILDEVLAFQDEIKKDIQRFKNVLAKPNDEPQIAMGAHCDSPYACNFTTYCKRLNPPVAVEEEPQPDSTITFDGQAIEGFNAQLQYPIHFLDFETVMYGVPQFDYSSPYQQIPFQYSLHIQHNANQLEHLSFLGDGINDPRLSFIQSLINNVQQEGSIVVWNATFERGCLLKLAQNFPQYKHQLEAIINRMVDLMVPFRRKQVNSEAFLGKYSIKYVLPVMIPHLQYSDLHIQDGGMASSTYASFPQMDESARAEASARLFEYCKLDTLAMVEILKKLNQ